MHRQVTVEGWRTAPAVAVPGGLNPQCLRLALASPPVLPIAWCAMGPLERGPGALGFGCPHEVRTLLLSTGAMEIVAVCLSGTRSRYSCSGWATGLRERWQRQQFCNMLLFDAGTKVLNKCEFLYR